MKYYLLYFFYRLYRCSERSGKNAPMIGVVYALTMLSYMNIVTILSIAHTALGLRIDIFDFIGRTKMEYALRIFIWSVIIYAILIISKAREKAFSENNIAIYKESGYNAISIVVYIVASIFLFFFALWKQR